MIPIVPLNKKKTAEYLSHTLPTRTEQSVSDGKDRLPRNLGNNDITKLLDDLDNQTEAIKSGQRIGDELLGDKIHTGGTSFFKHYHNARGHVFSDIMFLLTAN